MVPIVTSRPGLPSSARVDFLAAMYGFAVSSRRAPRRRRQKPFVAYTVNSDFVDFLARNQRPAGADLVAGAVAPSWLAALPPYWASTLWQS